MKCGLFGKLGEVKFWKFEVEGIRGCSDLGFWEMVCVFKYIWKLNRKVKIRGVIFYVFV